MSRSGVGTSSQRLEPADIRQLGTIVEFLARSHGVDVDHDGLTSALRRLASRPSHESLHGLVQELAVAGGLTTALVRRPLDEVIADADPSYPWLALRQGPEGRPEALAVLQQSRRGARVAVPGAHLRPAQWSVASLRQWFGVTDEGVALDWVLAEPAAPLALMRSAPGARQEPAARLRALLGAERRTLGVAVVYSVVIGLLSLVLPVAVQSLVNTIAFGSVLQPLFVLTLFVFVALGFSSLMNVLRAGVVEVVQRSIFARVATDVTWRLLRVRADAFDRFHGPELVNRFFDTVTVQKSASLLLIDGLSIVMQTAIGMVLLALYHPWLLAFDVLMVLAMLLIVFTLGRGAVHTSIKESKAKYALEAWLEQLAAHLVTFKSSGGPEYAVQRSQRLLEDYLSYRAKHFKILVRQIGGSFALQAIASAALLGVGGWLVIERQLTLGQLVASEIIVTLMMSAFTKFGKQLEVYYDLCAAIDKLGDLVDLPLERSGGEGLPPQVGPMGITMRDLSVSYEDGTAPALRVRQWQIAPGERIGVTGPNGSGKSTLADVLFGLRSAAGGTLQLDGLDMRDVPLGILRQQVALVRGVELFPGTVMDNVRLGRERVSHAAVSQALSAVGLMDEIVAMPHGLETELQPHGRPLSHRQACRLMIARAIVGSPRLIVLDGALDQIDRHDEQERLASVLFAPEAPWTLICITERPDVLERCARVVSLREGEVLETAGGAR